MYSQVSDKLARSGRVLDVIGKVLAVFCIITAVVTVFGTIILALLPEDIVMQILSFIPFTSRIDGALGDAGLLSSITTAIVASVKAIAIFSAIGFFAYCLLSAAILFILCAVFKATAVHRTPFLPENVKRLKIIGIIMIIASLALGFHNLIFAFCVFGLAYVVQYGAELQQQSDETL